MQIIIHDRSESNYDRAIQLINKTISLILMAVGRSEKSKYY